MKQCSKCKQMKIVTDYYRNKKNKDGLEYICKRCSKKQYNYNYYRNTKNNNKKMKEHWEYGKACIDGLLRNKKYRKDRTELFNKHGNGWWWGLDASNNERYLNTHRLQNCHNSRRMN